MGQDSRCASEGAYSIPVRLSVYSLHAAVCLVCEQGGVTALIATADRNKAIAVDVSNNLDKVEHSCACTVALTLDCLLELVVVWLVSADIP